MKNFFYGRHLDGGLWTVVSGQMLKEVHESFIFQVKPENCHFLVYFDKVHSSLHIFPIHIFISGKNVAISHLCRNDNIFARNENIGKIRLIADLNLNGLYQGLLEKFSKTLAIQVYIYA